MAIETKLFDNPNRDAGEFKEKRLVNQIKRRAIYSTPTDVAAAEKTQLSDIYADQLVILTKDSLLREFSRKR